MTKIDRIIKRIDKIIDNISLEEIDMRIIMDEYEKILNNMVAESIYEKEIINIHDEIKQYDIFEVHKNSTSKFLSEEVQAA